MLLFLENGILYIYVLMRFCHNVESGGNSNTWWETCSTFPCLQLPFPSKIILFLPEYDKLTIIGDFFGQKSILVS